MWRVFSTGKPKAWATGKEEYSGI